MKTFADAGVLAAGPREAGVIAAGHVFETDMPDGAWLALGHEVAPGGYAYLLVQGGRGTVASCMFTGFRDQARHVRAAEEFFRTYAGLEMRNARSFGGYGAYRWPRSAMQGVHPVIGEHAGFQDALAGFGIRHAIRSGVLAAECLLGGQDYAARWQSELGPLLEAGIVNRWMFGLGGEVGMRIASRKLATGDAGDVLRRAYDLTTFRLLALPIARGRYRKALEDPSCSHVNCDCVWCSHGDHSA